MRRAAGLLAAFALALSACGGGGSAPAPTTSNGAQTPAPAAPILAAPAPEALTVADVQGVIARAAGEATARGLPAVIAVVDRPGNVLAVYRMSGARDEAVVPRARDGSARDVQGLSLPAPLAAIAKAITSAYLSSSGNAFTTRTASQIVQEHFPPAPTTAGLESGPLFGVQFSQLPCSDLATRFTAAGAGALIGPKRSPLGLSADAGSVPLYKNGVVVGGVGVMADGVYGFDANILDTDEDAEELIALAASTGLEAPAEIRADRISVDGTTLRFADATRDRLRSDPASPPAFAALNGALLAIGGYADAVVRAGTAYGTEASGFRPATAAEFANPTAFVLSDGAGNNRYPPRAGTDGLLTAAEVRALMEEAFTVMSRARGQIRRPLDSRAQVSISVVDTNGAVLGVVRGPDAPIFGTDVSLQKARTAMFFSSAGAGAELEANRSADVRTFPAAARAFLGDAAALTGRFAFSDRANGNLSRPYFPDGEVGRPHGPFSRPIGQWSPFSTGLQSALILPDLAAALSPADAPRGCAGNPKLANGVQIFPGSVPIYRGAVLVGGIGVSGDGIDQDDMISFLGLHNAGQRLGIGNAPADRRADRVVVPVGAGVRLRYISCPFAPFLDTAAQNVCQGL